MTDPYHEGTVTYREETLDLLDRRRRRGNTHIKSKQLADDLDVPTRKAGYILSALDDEGVLDRLEEFGTRVYRVDADALEEALAAEVVDR